MSLFPVVSQLDAVDANYLTAVTQEGFLVHYHDLQRLDGPAPYDLEGGKHAKTSVWNQILHSPDRSSGFRSTTQRLIPDPFGKMKSTFSRKKNRPDAKSREPQRERCFLRPLAKHARREHLARHGSGVLRPANS